MKKLGFLSIIVVIWFVCMANPYARDRFPQKQPSSVPPVVVIYPEPEFSKGLSNKLCWSPVGEDSVEYRGLVIDLTTGAALSPCKNELIRLVKLNNEKLDLFEMKQNYYSKNKKKGFKNEGF